MTRVSVALAVYNGARFIQDQLDSFVRQTRLPDELVISDNCSTDGTIAIIEEFARHAPFPVRLFINDRNLGVNKNFERAISECSGDLIFLSDCDDVWYPAKIALMEPSFLRADVAVALCDADLVEDTLKPIGRSLFQISGFDPTCATDAALARGTDFNFWAPIWGNCMCFRAAFRDLILPLPDRTPYAPSYHDVFIAWTIWFSGSGQVRFLRDHLLAYRLHSGQLSGAPGPRLSTFERMRAFWRSRSYSKANNVRLIIDRLRERGCTSSIATYPHWHELFEHYWLRGTLPRRCWGRVVPVMHELLSMRYHRYSRGFASAVKDLLFVEAP